MTGMESLLDPSEEPSDDRNRGQEPSTDLLATWVELQAALYKRILPEQFETWFRRAALRSVTEDSICIAVQNSFAQGWLHTHYMPVIEHAVRSVLGSNRRVLVEVDPELTAEGSPAQEMRLDPVPTPERVPVRVARRQDVGVLLGSDTTLNPRYRFENFVVGPCNRFAHAAAVGTAEAPGKVYNPFFVHGSVGLGKTHLLQGLCSTVLDNDPTTRILYLSCETFVNHFISALENGDLQKFRQKYRNVDLLVVDDIHLLANKERTEEEFFHTFNTLYNAGKQIVLSSDSPPKDIPALQERLVSRFKWGLVTEIQQPCFETRMAIIQRLSKRQGLVLPQDVAQMVAERVVNNIRELEGAITKLTGYARLTGEAVTTDLALQALGDLFTSRTRKTRMEDILDTVTKYYSVKLSDLQSKRRTQAVVYPRQIAMFLARKHTEHSLSEIGGYFGGRDHSTVVHAIDKIGKLLDTTDHRAAAQLQELELQLGSEKGA